MTPLLYKFMRTGLKSDYDGEAWKLGERKTATGEIKTCTNGYHASKTPLDAFKYVQGEILAVVEGDGETHENTNKSAYEKMRVIKAYLWKKEDSVALAVFCARLVLQHFEKQQPDDPRPRNAIEAAEKWLKNPTSDNAAWAEGAASTASAARAESAARAARAESAASAESAAWAASAASAESAAWAGRAARAAAINSWMVERIKKLEEIV